MCGKMIRHSGSRCGYYRCDKCGWVMTQEDIDDQKLCWCYPTCSGCGHTFEARDLSDDDLCVFCVEKRAKGEL